MNKQGVLQGLTLENGNYLKPFGASPLPSLLSQPEALLHILT